MNIVLLGATGSIGLSTLDVVARHPQHYRVLAVTAHRDHERLAEQCLRYRPRYAVMVDSSAATVLRERLAGRSDTQVLSGVKALAEVASLDDADVVVAAIVGAAGLLPTLAAAHAGKRVLLANKEALVMSGRLLMDAARAGGAVLLPVDSEHNAIFQCLPPLIGKGIASAGVRRILLTGSGGPFRLSALGDLHAVTPEQACAHPNWSMGRKISVDSATMMNKGLEVIEACWLFNAATSQVQVVVHPQSVVHSMVEYEDGSVLAQLGNPDMRTPIAHALAWPQRIDSGVAPLDLIATGRLDFQEPDVERFPCLRLGYEAARGGCAASALLNAANEVAVEAFLKRQLRFTDISAVLSAVMDAGVGDEPDSVDAVLAVDAEGRARAERAVAARCM